MPTYEYCCHECGHRFERFQGMSEAPLRSCLRCGGPVIEDLLAGSGKSDPIAVLFPTKE